MLRPLNRFSTALSALIVTACFNPNAPDSETDNGTSGSGDSSATGSGDSLGTSGPNEGTDASVGTTDSGASSGDTDLPPEITSFTVNGSKSPAEIDVSGQVMLDADASDDIGIDRVEFYDGEQLIAASTASPYRVEVLFSSANNGAHSLWARAIDTSGQEGTSNSVDFSVNIIGGQILEIRENIGEVISIFLLTSPRISAEGSSVHIAARAQDPADSSADGFAYWAYDSDLSLVHRSQSPGSGEDSEYNAATPPNLSASGSHVLVGGAAALAEGDRTVMFSIDTTTSDIQRVDLEATDGVRPTPLAIDSEGNVLLCPTHGQVVKYSPDMSRQIWTNSIGDLSTVSTFLLIDEDNNVLVTFATAECSPTSTWCVRKIRPDGDTEWTRGIADIPIGAALSPSGELAVATGFSAPPSTIDVIDRNGESQRLWQSDDSLRTITNIAYDPQGNLVTVGYLSNGGGPDERVAWATRLGPDGGQIWERTYKFDSASNMTGVAVDPDGRTYVVGHTDVVDTFLLGYVALGFVAELSL